MGANSTAESSPPPSVLISNAVFSSFSTSQLEFLPFRSMSYTSLKDLVPMSPGSQSSGEIPIKNRLVKQAAWAYLQPLSISPVTQNRSLLRRLGLRCSGEFQRIRVDGCFLFINHGVFPAIRRVVGSIFRAVCRRKIRNFEANVISRNCF